MRFTIRFSIIRSARFKAKFPILQKLSRHETDTKTGSIPSPVVTLHRHFYRCRGKPSLRRREMVYIFRGEGVFFRPKILFLENENLQNWGYCFPAKKWFSVFSSARNAFQNVFFSSKNVEKRNTLFVRLNFVWCTLENVKYLVIFDTPIFDHLSLLKK